VFDDLERALQAMPTTDLASTEQVWHTGLQGIMKNLQQTWQKIGLQEVDASGVFDPELHEALCQVPADGIESGHVAAVLRKGYLLNGIVIRHAQVSVAE
jgi:molecular chaperone GrpE